MATNKRPIHNISMCSVTSCVRNRVTASKTMPMRKTQGAYGPDAAVREISIGKYGTFPVASAVSCVATIVTSKWSLIANITATA